MTSEAGAFAETVARAEIYVIGGADPAAPPSADVLGFKAYNLARMARLGLPVPPAFVLGTGFCFAATRLSPAELRGAVDALQCLTRLRFGDPGRPLLVSVRSGAPVSMPGMMETLLNIGLTDATLPGLIRLTGDPRLAWDAYRRLVAGFGEVVAGVPAEVFEADLAAVAGDQSERDLDFAALRDLTHRHLVSYEKATGAPFPQDPHAQLTDAIAAVFRSWSADKARIYRDMRGLPHTMGTAVTVQRMVFGNAGGLSGAGVGFTRNPTDGTPQPWVDFLFNAQGEDVVSGRRSVGPSESLGQVAPRLWDELVAATHRLEAEFHEMQDFEFTVEDGRLFLLQTRDGKRTPQAAARIALDMLDEGLIDRETARARTANLDCEKLCITRLFGAECNAQPLAEAATAASGAVSGLIALTEDSARRFQAAGHKVILVRRDAETSDIAALDVADGLLTQHGARTSHAAVVARQLGKVCLVGCEQMSLDAAGGRVGFAGRTFTEGDTLTLDGNTGRVFAGEMKVTKEAPADLIARLAALRDGTLTNERGDSPPHANRHN